MPFKRLVILCALAIMVATVGRSEGQQERLEALYLEANEAYKAGAFDTAKVLYSQIVETGYEAPELYFNLANSMFKRGNLPGSILFYERAKKLAPEDDDIRYNLELAYGKITDEVESIPQFFLSAWWQNFAGSRHSNVWVTWFLITLSCACAFIVFMFLSERPERKKSAFIAAVLGAMVSAFFLLSAYSAYSYETAEHLVIFSPSVSVKSEPRFSAPDQFVIHEGLKVEVLDRDDEWWRIELADGKNGWIPAESGEKI